MIIFILIITLLILSFLMFVSGKSFLSLISHFIVINKKKFWIIYIITQLLFLSLLAFQTRSAHIVNGFFLGFMFYFILLSGIAALIKLIPLKLNFKIIDVSKVILTILIVIIGAINANTIRITTYEVNINKSISDLNIVVFSDTHFGFQIGQERVQRIVRKTNELKPDLVLIPGDIFDSSFYNLRDADDVIYELRKIESTYGVFATFGNHDLMGYEDQIRDFLYSSNITLLEDDVVEVAGLTLIGRKDLNVQFFGYERLTVLDLLDGVNTNAPIIVMDHQPNDIQSGINNFVDLFIVGHSHNGQVFPGSLVTNALFLVGYGHALFNNTHVIVTSGVSWWGPPIRIGSISEIVHIKLSGTH